MTRTMLTAIALALFAGACGDATGPEETCTDQSQWMMVRDSTGAIVDSTWVEVETCSLPPYRLPHKSHSGMNFEEGKQ